MNGSSIARIRELNDAFRTTLAGGKMVMSASVAALPEMVRASALVKVAEFTDFTQENDPHGEHDFLSFEHCNRTLEPVYTENLIRVDAVMESSKLAK